MPVVLLGDFNVNLLEKTSEEKALTRCLVEERGYTQLIKQYTTDYRSLIDHIYTNIPHFVMSSGVLESYYSDHKLSENFHVKNNDLYIVSYIKFGNISIK